MTEKEKIKTDILRKMKVQYVKGSFRTGGPDGSYFDIVNIHFPGVSFSIPCEDSDFLGSVLSTEEIVKKNLEGMKDFFGSELVLNYILDEIHFQVNSGYVQKLKE